MLAHKHKSQRVKNKNKHVYKHEVVLTSSDEVFFVALHRTCLFLIQYLFQGGSLLGLLCRLLREPIVFNLGLVGVDNGSGIFFFHMGTWSFLKLKIFYPPKVAARAAPMGSISTSFFLIICQGSSLALLKTQTVRGLFENLKMFAGG